jgi:hypothetical protein
VRVYARLGHIKRAMRGQEQPADWPSMRQVYRIQCSEASRLGLSVRVDSPVAQHTIQKLARTVMASEVITES